MNDEEFNKKVDTRIAKVVSGYLKTSAFTDRKLTDTPTDGLQVVNRNYITNHGAASGRPTASVIGQPYFDTSLGNGKPIYWNGTGFVDATGTYV